MIKVSLGIQDTLFTFTDSYIVAGVSYDEAEETVTLSFETPLPTGRATLAIEYEGVLNDKMRGFYRTKYNLKSSGTECYAAVTQFEVRSAMHYRLIFQYCLTL